MGQPPRLLCQEGPDPVPRGPAAGGGAARSSAVHPPTFVYCRPMRACECMCLSMWPPPMAYVSLLPTRAHVHILLPQSTKQVPSLEVLRLGESRFDDSSLLSLDAVALAPIPPTASLAAAAAAAAPIPSAAAPAPTPPPTTTTTTTILFPNLWWLDLCDSDMGDASIRRLLSLAATGRKDAMQECICV